MRYDAQKEAAEAEEGPARPYIALKQLSAPQPARPCKLIAKEAVMHVRRNARTCIAIS